MINNNNNNKENQMNIFIGQSATYSIGGDSYPYTVVNYENGVVTLQSDKTQPTGNHDYYNNQSYLITSDTNGRKKSYKQYSYYGEQRWFEVFLNQKTGRWNKESHPSFLHFGKKVFKQDPNF
tara:strand:- start:181 stop:546 length:366 start_codon:yes stop_codon:yes gene_type:complete